MASQEPIKLTLLGNKETGVLLHAESGKDFVDLLCSFLHIPPVALLNLLKNAANGRPSNVFYPAVRNIFRSLEALPPGAWAADRASLFGPAAQYGPGGSSVLLAEAAGAAAPQWFKPQCGCAFICLSPAAKCPNHDRPFCNPVKVHRPPPAAGSAAAAAAGGGFLRDATTFIITDCLDIFPSTTMRSISILNDLGIEKLSSLASMDVALDKEKVIRLLVAANTSKTALNDVFGAAFKDSFAAADEGFLPD